MLGALDISGDHRNSQPHTLGLARMGVRLVERRMFESEHARHAIFAFHPRPEGVGGLQEGLLADASGLILHGIGDPAFVDRASRVALQPGASWSECQRGTNAIGATLIERAPVEIFGAEHYLECNGVLT